MLWHDRSKFEHPEKLPYIWIKWAERNKIDLPVDLLEKANEATLHHVKNNRHHPEFYDETSSINFEDRNEIPNRVANASAMPREAIAEMIADWCAVSEFKGTHPLNWAKRNVNVRWNFNPEQVKLIYELLKIFDQ